MADWKIYCEDLLEGLYTLGSSTVDGVNDSSLSSTAPDACDLDHATFWDPTGTGTQSFYVNLPTARSSKNVKAIGFGNAIGMAGLSCTLYSSATLWATNTTPRASFTAPTASTFVVECSSIGAAPYWRLDVAGTSSTFKVGDVALLSEPGLVTCTGIAAPQYPVGRPMMDGTVDVPLAGGSVIQQILGGTREMVAIDGIMAKGGSATDPYDLLRALFHSTRRFSGGLWITDPDYTSPGAALRGVLAPGTGIDAQLVMAQLYRLRLQILTLSSGVDLT